MISPVRPPTKAAFGSPVEPTQHIPQVDGQVNGSDESEDESNGDEPPKPVSSAKVQSHSTVKSSARAASGAGTSQTGLISELTSGGSDAGNAGNAGPSHSPISNKSFVFKKVSLHAKGRKFGDKKRDQPGENFT